MGFEFKHNRKRNGPLVFEFLVRRMATSVLSQDRESYSRALSLVKRHYSDGRPLAQEKSLFDVIVSSRGVSEQAARKILIEVKKASQALDGDALFAQKSKLIGEVNRSFGKNFFASHRVPEYRVFASIYLLLEQYRQKDARLEENVSRVSLEENIISYMVAKDQPQKNTARTEVDGLVAALALRKYQDKYGRALDERQKRTIRSFLDFSTGGNREKFTREMEEERASLLEELSSVRSDECFKQDAVMAQRMDEALSLLGRNPTEDVESEVQEVMLFQRLLSEVKSR